MKTKYFNIPVFIPELACPFRCIYCNQRKISGTLQVPEPASVNNIIDTRLATLPQKGSHIEIAFFGGNFTGLPPALQRTYLDIAVKYYHKGLVSGIRLSTRPDYINEETIALLLKYPVTTVEIGAQSLDEDVLICSGRGHTVADVELASALVKKAGFSLGLQMMTGLPGDSREKSVRTAQKIAALGADIARIYPTLVIKGTVLERMYCEGEYKPQTMEEAVDLTAKLIMIFEKAKVRVIRTGLHVSEGLLNGHDLVAGPFSPSFGEMVRSKLWEEALWSLLCMEENKKITIVVSPGELNYAIGYRSSNRNMLMKRFGQVIFRKSEIMSGREFGVELQGH
ncbi:MAG: radical SAM protein [Bacteroidales bacterium]|nr:radical SAM protein [Bacteroidales bacterium]